MTKPKILKEVPITMSELKGELAKIRKRDDELNFRANKTDEYLNQFTLLSNAKAKELSNTLEKLNIPRLRDIHIAKIVDVLPLTVDDLKVVLQGYTITINQENLKKIVKEVEKFPPEK